MLLIQQGFNLQWGTISAVVGIVSFLLGVCTYVLSLYVKSTIQAVEHKLTEKIDDVKDKLQQTIEAKFVSRELNALKVNEIEGRLATKAETIRNLDRRVQRLESGRSSHNRKAGDSDE